MSFYTLTLKDAKLKEFQVMETSSTASNITLINNRKANLKGSIILSPAPADAAVPDNIISLNR
jgi:hypothetical protein